MLVFHLTTISLGISTCGVSISEWLGERWCEWIAKRPSGSGTRSNNGINPYSFTFLRRDHISLRKHWCKCKFKLQQVDLRMQGPLCEFLSNGHPHRHKSHQKSHFNPQLLRLHHKSLWETEQYVQNNSTRTTWSFSLFVFQIKIPNKNPISSYLCKKWNFWNPVAKFGIDP